MAGSIRSFVRESSAGDHAMDAQHSCAVRECPHNYHASDRDASTGRPCPHPVRGQVQSANWPRPQLVHDRGQFITSPLSQSRLCVGLTFSRFLPTIKGGCTQEVYAFSAIRRLFASAIVHICGLAAPSNATCICRCAACSLGFTQPTHLSQHANSPDPIHRSKHKRLHPFRHFLQRNPPPGC
jgi:hypothetical protein